MAIFKIQIIDYQHKCQEAKKLKNALGLIRPLSLKGRWDLSLIFLHLLGASSTSGVIEYSEKDMAVNFADAVCKQVRNFDYLSRLHDLVAFGFIEALCDDGPLPAPPSVDRSKYIPKKYQTADIQPPVTAPPAPATPAPPPAKAKKPKLEAPKLEAPAPLAPPEPPQEANERPEMKMKIKKVDESKPGKTGPQNSEDARELAIYFFVAVKRENGVKFSQAQAGRQIAHAEELLKLYDKDTIKATIDWALQEPRIKPKISDFINITWCIGQFVAQRHSRPYTPTPAGPDVYSRDMDGYITWDREKDPSEDPNIPLEALSEDCMTRRLMANGMLVNYFPNMDRLHEPELQTYIRELIRRDPAYQDAFRAALDAIERMG